MSDDGTTASPTDPMTRLRDVLAAINGDAFQRGFRRLPTAVQAAIAAEARAPLPLLRRSDRPGRFLSRLRTAHLVVGLSESISVECLEAIAEILNESFDEPTAEELAAAVDNVLERFPADEVALVLATTAASDAPAHEHCAALLDTDPRLAVSADAETEGEPSSSPRNPPEQRRASEDVRAARRERRQSRGRATPKSAPPRYSRGARPTGTDAGGEQTATGDADSEGEPPATARRSPVVTTAMAQEFDTDDPLVGAVVYADVTFDDDDPGLPGITSKVRPCVVIGVSDDRLLVRAGYSAGGVRSQTWKSIALQDWARAGLREATWIETKIRSIPRDAAETSIGRLADDDWNSLW